MAADLLLINGNFLTIDDAAPKASAIIFSGGRVARVGDTKTLRNEARPDTSVVDLGGRTAIPAFTDAHAHVWKMGHLLTTMLDLRKTTSIEDLVSSVNARHRSMPAGQWLLGRGFNEVIMSEKRKPTRRDLDRAAPDRPVALTRTCGHIYAVNSLALKLAGITANTEPPVGGVIERDENGEPNGLLHEMAMGLVNEVLPPPSNSDYEQMIHAALRHQLSLGITASADCGVIPELLEVYREMDRRGEMPARVNVMPLRRVDSRKDPVPLPELHRSDMLHVDTVKFLADGGLSGDCALSVRYRHADTKGTLRFDPRGTAPARTGIARSRLEDRNSCNRRRRNRSGAFGV